MRRYWLSSESFFDHEIRIEGDDFKHICLVCRRSLGDKFEVLQENQKAYLVELVEVGKKQAVARIIEAREIPSLPRPHIHLALSLPKISTLEKVIEKSVELGVKGLHVFSSDFSFAKFSAKDFSKKEKRWQKILQGATQQTGRGELMELTYGDDLATLLKGVGENSGAKGVFAFEGEGQKNLEECLKDLPKGLGEVWIFVGAEGGFSQKDVELFSNYGMIPTSLGNQILRVETACVTLISVIKYDLGLF